MFFGLYKDYLKNQLEVGLVRQPETIGFKSGATWYNHGDKYSMSNEILLFWSPPAHTQWLGTVEHEAQ